MTKDVHLTSDPDMERLTRRNRAERRFQYYGIAAIVIALTFLVAMFASVAVRGVSAFQHTMISLDVTFDAKVIDPDGTRDPETMRRADYGALVKDAMRKQFPDVKGRSEKKDLYELISKGASYNLLNQIWANPDLIGGTQTMWVTASDDVDVAFGSGVLSGRLTDQQLDWMATLVQRGRMEKQFNTTFFTAGDSREPELAGILGAFMGSVFSLAVCFLLSFPLAVLSAIYLEEFAPRNRWTELIEVNINNLAAVPSIVFGLLGLAFFLNFVGLPRSAPLVGGMVLALMTLPTIIISARVALQAVPPSIREAALAVGASPIQTVLHHVLPLSLPGILTGTIIGMARALGETAPLLMIGMVAFVVDVPTGWLDPATALPVQIFLWADAPERSFEQLTAAAIIVLLVVLVAMNATAVILRKKYEVRW